MTEKRSRLGAASTQVLNRRSTSPDLTSATITDDPHRKTPGIVAALQRDDQRAGGVVTLRLDQVAEHPNNPRSTLGDLAQLAGSIEKLGVLQPILVSPVAEFLVAHPEHAEAVAGREYVITGGGHRRRAASQLAGRDTIPALIRARADRVETLVTLIDENVHRAGLDPIEEARGYSLLTDAGLTQNQVAAELRVSQSQVSKRLALLRLPQPVQDALTEGTLSVADALTLSAVPAEDQSAVWDLAQAENRPLSSAVTTMQRRREAEAVVTAAREQAATEQVRLVEDPAKEWGNEHWHRRIESKKDITKARQTGNLRAHATATGLQYYTASVDAPKESPHTTQQRDEDRARRAAMKARTEAAGRLVQDAPTEADATSATLAAVLLGGIHYADTLKLAHRWLGDRYGTPTRDSYAWARDLVTGSKAAQLHVAWAFTIAHAELGARSTHGRWTTEHSHYLDRLKSVGWEPTPWEAERLANITAAPTPNHSHDQGNTDTEQDDQ